MSPEPINLEKCLPPDWAFDRIPESVEVRFLSAMYGYKPDEVRDFRLIAEIAARVNTFAALESLTERLVGHPLRKRLLGILGQLGAAGRTRLYDEGVDRRDFIRSAIILLFPYNDYELEEIVAVCLAYSEAVAALDDSAIVLQLLRETDEGRSYLRVLKVDDSSSREAAKMEGVSHVAIANRDSRLRARLCHER